MGVLVQTTMAGKDPKGYYSILGLKPTATDNEISKAYKKAALKYHPDRNKSPEAEGTFKKIQEAKSVLTNPTKKKNYDTHGDPEGPKGSGSIFDLFTGGPRESGPRKTDSLRYNQEVDLADFYKGKEIRIKIRRDVICAKCEGSGSKVKGADTVCHTCDGKGWKMEVKQSGFMIQQMQVACPDCQGNGITIKPADRCPECKGHQVIEKEEHPTIFVEKGMKDKDKVILREKANEAPGHIAGDIHVVLHQKPNALKRSGKNLILVKDVTLKEALCGFSFKFEHLDERVIVIRSGAGVITKPQDVQVVKGEGMPTRGRPFDKGDLLIKFNIVFPESLTDAQTTELLKHLPGTDPEKIKAGELEEFTLEPFDEERYIAQEKEERQRARNAYDEDERGGHPGGAVPCTTQ